MKRSVFIVGLFLLVPLAAQGQDDLQMLARKVNEADRAAAMKMFDELEEKNLLGVSEECEIVNGKARRVTRFSFHLPLSKNAKALYYCYKLKTGSAEVRRLAAENLRAKPARDRRLLPNPVSRRRLTDNYIATAGFIPAEI